MYDMNDCTCNREKRARTIKKEKSAQRKSRMRCEQRNGDAVNKAVNKDVRYKKTAQGITKEEGQDEAEGEERAENEPNAL